MLGLKHAGRFKMSINYSYLNMRNTPVAAKLATNILLAGTLVVGTGSVYEMKNAKIWLPYIEPRVPYEFDAETLKETACHLGCTDVRTVVQHIENIRHVFNIPISDIAYFIGVSRQAIYKWLASSSIPEQDKHDRIIAFSHIADKFQEAGISNAGWLLKMKTFSGRSLMDILIAGEDANQYIVALIKESKITEAAYKRSGLSSSKAKPTNDWQSTISIPGSFE